MIDQVAIGASVSMTPQEVLKLADGPVRLVTCPDGQVVGGSGVVGFVKHHSNTNLTEFMAEIESKRVELVALAAAPPPDNPRASLYTFIRI
jgi:hypothetical protein